MKKIVPGLLYTLPWLVLSIGVKTFFSPCIHADGTAAACGACGNAVFVSGIVLAAAALFRALLTKKARIAADAVLALGSLYALLIPVLMKTCMMSAMRCNALMKPAVWLVSGIGIILFAAVLIHDLRVTKEKEHA